MTNETTPHLSPHEETIWLTVRISESIVIVIINAFTVTAFARNRHLRKRSTYLIINLTVADLLVGAVAAPLDISYPGIGFTPGFSWKFFSILTAYGIFQISSLANLCLISLERLHATLFPFAHCLIKEWFYFKTIICSWVLALLIAAVDAALNLYKPEISYYLWVAIMFLTLLIFTVSYFIIIVKIKSAPPPHPCGAVASDWKLSVTLFIVTTVSVLTILPYAIYSFFVPNSLWEKLSLSVRIQLSYTVNTLYYACSFVNPLIYAIRMQDFRKAVYKQLICKEETADSNRAQPIELHVM